MTSFIVITAGCAHNQVDSEQMAGLLKRAKFDLASDIEKADIVIFNTCTVKGPSETAFFKQLDDLKKNFPYKMVVVAGCIAQADPEKLKKYSLVGTKQIHNIAQVVEEALHNNVLQLLETNAVLTLKLPRIRKNPIVEILPINLGCLGSCSFCKTKQARGNLISYPIAELKAEMVKAIKEGVKEIWLTSQDTGCYGADIGTNLVDLIKELCTVTGEYMIRIGMMNPDQAIKIKKELIDLFRTQPKLFMFLHLPVQSGSNYILKRMARNYTGEDFYELVKELKLNLPGLNVMTDIIVGFPGETEQDSWQTLSMLRKVSPDSVNISRFWPRSKTSAAKWRVLPGEVVKRRSRLATELFHNISRLQNERWLGWEGEILIDELGEKEGQWIGRNCAYKQVLVEGKYNIGQRLRVKIGDVTTFDLRGMVTAVKRE
ncbi:tRNA (N(6)-L-threonylcarbamoyladenosine(37)-C(2))-methylthiotransferase [Candidatus Woesearchaeota archaeon]|nr:tRNA (N(6)-L-threonylcarbamoyladenosine(37)-C(2))-methylthiotransferase [Candidatus Woesearchaeota archaeon]